MHGDSLCGRRSRSTVPELNEVGDVVLTDPAAMRALADPARLSLLDRLRRDGPGAMHAEAEEHLRALEEVGLVERDESGRWRAVGRGILFEIPDDPEAAAAARALSNVMLMQYAGLPGRWVAEDEPRLDLKWARSAGLFNARVRMTPAELRELQEALERLLEPLINREPPSGAAQVRVLSYFLPEPTAAPS
jgi:DNA-binding transcriptional ArsR family regulator